MAVTDALTAAASGAVSGAGATLATANPYLIAGGATIGLAAGVIGYLIQEGYEDEAREIEKQARAMYGNVSDEAVRAAAAQVLGPTALAKITTDPRFKVAQEETLAALKQISDGGGYNIEDRANLNRMQNEVARRDAQRRASALERLASRGIAGGGAETAMNIAAQQDAANRESQASLDIAAAGRARALAALRERAALAGSMEGNEWNRKAQVASAQDAIDRLNNTNQYERARHTYNRDRNNADRQLGFEERRADQERASGRRLAQGVEGTVRGAGNIVTGFANYNPGTDPSGGGTADGWLASQGLTSESNTEQPRPAPTRATTPAPAPAPAPQRQRPRAAADGVVDSSYSIRDAISSGYDTGMSDDERKARQDHEDGY